MFKNTNNIFFLGEVFFPCLFCSLSAKVLYFSHPQAPIGNKVDGGFSLVKLCVILTKILFFIDRWFEDLMAKTQKYTASNLTNENYS